MTVFGIHTNAQNKPLGDLIDVWRYADALGYGWISISDHFPGSLGPDSSEAVATHAAMACSTTRAQCGVLVYSIGFRHPAVLASAATTIDHLSGGRAAIGLGAGSVPRDYELYGFPYPSLGDRMDMLEEGVRCVAGLLRDEVVDFEGKHFRMAGARNGPRTVQERLPVWVGTKGEKRGLRIVAQYADGWNSTFPTLTEFARMRGVLGGHCRDVGRDLADVRCSVNLVLALGDHAASIPQNLRGPSALTGTVSEALERINAYVGAGADQINFFLGYPWDFEGLAELAERLGLDAA